MKRFAKAAVVLTALSMAVTAGTIGAEAKTIKLSTTKSTESYLYAGLERFKQEVEEKSGGDLVVELYPASQLGGQNETIEGMEMGTIEMAYISAGATEGFFPKSGLMGTLFTARDEDHALKIWKSDKGKEIVDEMISSIGVRMLDFSIEGVRSIWSKSEITGLDSLKGLKMRVPEVPMFINTFTALGVNPTPMALSEVYTGLQTNIIDGLEFDLNGTIENNFTDHCKYCYETNHGVSIMAFMAGEIFWSGLTDDEKTIISDAAAKVSAELVDEYYKEVEESRAKLEEMGVTFVKPTDEERTHINELMTPIISDYIKDYATEEDLEALRAIE